MKYPVSRFSSQLNFIYMFKPPTVIFTAFLLTCLMAPLMTSCAKADNYRIPRTQVPYVINNTTYYPLPTAVGYAETGIASWYGDDFHGRPTSNGETYNMHSMTAAHKTLPMNTMLLVKNIENGRETVVRVNDRGPFVRGRIIDLSLGAAKTLNIVNRGTARVKVVALVEESLLAGSKAGLSALPDLTHGEYYIQIGAFIQKENASRLQKRFTDAGHTTIIQKHYAPDTVFYRVHVYAGKELTAARQAEATLHTHGYDGAFVVAR